MLLYHGILTDRRLICLYSYLASRLLHTLGLPCDVSSLRLTNIVFLLLLFLAAFLYRLSSNSLSLDMSKAEHRSAFRVRFATDIHTAVNVCLFPPLFFFSGLYYTDVGSTAAVIWFMTLMTTRSRLVRYLSKHLALSLCLAVALSCIARGSILVMGVLFLLQTLLTTSNPLANVDSADVATEVKPTPAWTLLLLGILALTFRQTNIFWVAVFPFGLRVVMYFDRQRRLPEQSDTDTHDTSWVKSDKWTPIVNDAGFSGEI